MLLFFSLNVRVAMRFTAKARWCLNAKFHPDIYLGGGRTSDGHMIIKISHNFRLPFLVTHGASLRVIQERELRYDDLFMTHY